MEQCQQQHADVVVGDGVGRQQVYRPGVRLRACTHELSVYACADRGCHSHTTGTRVGKAPSRPPTTPSARARRLAAGAALCLARGAFSLARGACRQLPAPYPPSRLPAPYPPSRPHSKPESCSRCPAARRARPDMAYLTCLASYGLPHVLGYRMCPTACALSHVPYLMCATACALPHMLAPARLTSYASSSLFMRLSVRPIWW